MPVFPQYGGVSTGIPLQNMASQDVPVDPMGRQVERLGNAAEAAVTNISAAQRRMQELQDEAQAQQRYMQAVMDMEGIHETLNVPANAMNGKALFAQGYAEKEPEWYKGLNGNASAILQKKLFGKSLEYKVGAAKLENRAKLEDYNATMVRAESWYADAESRRIDPSDGSTSKEYLDYTQMVDAGVAAGYIDPKQGEIMKDSALKHGAKSRAYKVTASDSKVELQHMLDLYKKEAAEPGSTFLKHMKPDDRTSMQKQTEERLHSLEGEEQRKIAQERAETERQNKDLRDATSTMAAQKLRNPEKYGALTQDWIDQAADLRLLDDKDVIRFSDAVADAAKSGTPTGKDDPSTFQSLQSEVYDTRSPEHAMRVRDRVKEMRIKGLITTQTEGVWLNHLEEKVKAAGTDPQIHRTSNMVKDWIDREIKTTGPLANMDPSETVEINAMKQQVELMEMSGAPPGTIVKYYNDNIAAAKGRVLASSRAKTTVLRRSMGLPPASDPKEQAETIAEAGRKLDQELKSAPPGQEGNAIRASVRERARRLKEIEDVEKAMQKHLENLGQSKAAKSQSSASPSASPSKPQQQSISGAPQLGPRR